LTTDTAQIASLSAHFTSLQNAFLDNPYPSIHSRIAILKKLRSRIVELEEELISAVSKDFGYRTAFDTLLGDILPTVQGLSHIIKKLSHRGITQYS